MIYQLVKRDVAWKALPIAAMLVALYAFTAAVVIQVPWIALKALCIGILAVVAGVGQLQGRDTPFLVALPLTIRQIFLSRVVAMIALVWFPALIEVVISSVAGTLAPSAFLVLAAFAMPVALALQTLAILQVRGPMRAPGTAVLIALATGSVAFSRTAPPPIPTLRVLATSVIVSAVFFLVAWNRIPAHQMARPAAATRLDQAHVVRARRFPWWWLFSRWDAVWFPLLFFVTFTGPWFSGLLFLWSGPPQARERQRWLDPLPVSRRLLLFTRLVPCLTALVCGYLSGIHIGPADQPRWNKVYITAGRGWPPSRATSSCVTLNVAPPLEYWRPVQGGAPPLVRAPWGESYQLPAVRIYGSDVYNPYGVGCESTQRFLDWQYERASLAAYGRLMPKNDPRVHAVPRVRTQILTVGAILTGALLVVFPLIVCDWRRVTRMPRWFRVALMVAGLAGLVGMVLTVSIVSIVRDSVYFPANAVQWVSWWLPETPWVALLAAFAIPLAVYLTMERVFLASELTEWKSAGNYN